jgi:hypothetical protein
LPTCRSLAENLKEVGIELTVHATIPTSPQWLDDPEATGNLRHACSRIIDGNATPYRFYRHDHVLATCYAARRYTFAQGNYTRYAGGAADELLHAVCRRHRSLSAAEADCATELQASLCSKRRRRCRWCRLGGMGLVNTTRFTGFPTADNYYASARA